MRRLTWFLALTAAIATCTWVAGWWMVPVVALVFGWVRREDAVAPFLAGLAGVLGWGMLIWIASLGAPRGSVMTAVGAAMQVGSGAVLGLSLAFPALLSASAVGVVRAFGGRRVGAE